MSAVSSPALGNTRPTRYPELGYRQDAPGLWRIVATDGNASVGPQYRSKTELLADLERFATEYGCAAAGPPAEMDGRRIWRHKDTGAIWIGLPVACHRPISGQCTCDVCKATGETGAWDTLVIDPGAEYTRLVHFPSLRHVGLMSDYARSKLETVIS